MREALTLNQAFVAAAGALRQAGIDTPELDARLLLCHAAALSHETYVARSGEALPAEARAMLDAAIARRLKREPVARITGQREFYGRSFRVDGNVLDPRPDTETLIEAVLADVEAWGLRAAPLRLLDLGTGSGCILITLLAELPNAQGIGSDQSEAALTVAAENARRLGVEPRARFLAADWLDGIDGRFDLIVSNPPYLATRELADLAAEVAGYDPHLALDGGADGLDAYRAIAAAAGQALSRQGRLFLEIGPSQAKPVAAILRHAGLEPEGPALDLAGRARVVTATVRCKA